MAETYTQFAEGLADLTDEERSWCKEELGRREEVDPSEDEVGCVDFDYHFEDQGRTLLIYSDESGSVESAADFIQAFLSKWRPNGIFSLTWSGSCSKPRASQFGGGAVVITADDTVYMNTWDWASYQIVEIEHDREAKR